MNCFNTTFYHVNVVGVFKGYHADPFILHKLNELYIYILPMSSCSCSQRFLFTYNQGTRNLKCVVANTSKTFMCCCVPDISHTINIVSSYVQLFIQMATQLSIYSNNHCLFAAAFSTVVSLTCTQLCSDLRNTELRPPAMLAMGDAVNFSTDDNYKDKHMNMHTQENK